MIEVTNLVKSYGEVRVLKGVNFSLAPGQQCVVRGASGSGKSTLLYLLAGLEAIEQGNVVVDGLALEQLKDQELAQYRNSRVGLVFQFHFLLSSMKVIDNIYLPARIGRGLTSEIRDRVAELAGSLGVEHCLGKYPHQLSGGEQQRVNIIRACSQAPRVLLCDEPTGNLDSHNSQKVATCLQNLSQTLDICLVVVTHDPQIVTRFKKVLTLSDGQLTPPPSQMTDF